MSFASPVPFGLMKTRTFAAILLDFDGTIVDSEPVHCRAHQQFLASQGIDISEAEILRNIGKSDRLFYLDLMERYGKPGDVFSWMAAKSALVMKLYREHGLRLRPGVKELLDEAARTGVASCLVTSSEREVAALGLALVGLDRRIMSRICSEDVSMRKPAPDPYLLAAMRLGVPPRRCLAVEDSPNGIRSAVTAGCITVALEGIISAADLLAAGASRCVRSLAELVPLDRQPGATSTFRRVSA